MPEIQNVPTFSIRCSIFWAIIVPGVGLAGQLLVQIPGSLLEWAHAPGYGILALLLTRGLQRRAWPLAYALPVAAAAALVFGLWTEVFQGSDIENSW